MSFLKSPRAKIYLLASRTKCKFLFPQFFSGLAQLLDNFLFAHTLEWRRFPGYAFAKFLPQSFGLFYIPRFHRLSPLFKFTSKLIYCQISLLLLIFVSSATATTSLTYDYDANGNLIQGDGKYYEYNDANQLIRVRHGDQNGPVIAE